MKTIINKKAALALHERKFRPLKKRIWRFSRYSTAIIFFLITFFLFNNYSGKINEYIRNKFYASTSKMGMVVKNIYIEDITNLNKDEIIFALQNNKNTFIIGSPILSVPILNLKKNLEKLGWVKEAHVSRHLPNTLHIKIVERIPYAIWKNKKGLYLIDEEGNLIDKQISKEYFHLPIAIGENANSHIRQIMEILYTKPNLAKQVTAVKKVNERRWNVLLNDRIEIKLPAENVTKAWKRLAKMQNEQNILNRNITAVDLRIPNRSFISLAISD